MAAFLDLIICVYNEFQISYPLYVPILLIANNWMKLQRMFLAHLYFAYQFSNFKIHQLDFTSVQAQQQRWC